MVTFYDPYNVFLGASEGERIPATADTIKGRNDHRDVETKTHELVYMLLGLSPNTSPAHVSQSEVNILAENMVLLAKASEILDCLFFFY